MHTILASLFFLVTTTQIEASAERQQKLLELEESYSTAVSEYQEVRLPDDATDSEKIRHYQAWPGWKFLPEFVHLAKETPDDDVAFACCDWIIARCSNVGNSEIGIYEPEKFAWNLLLQHHSQRDEIRQYCLRAMQYSSPAREQFLRSILEDYRQPVAAHGYAFLALAELLARNHELSGNGGIDGWAEPQGEYERYLRSTNAPQWIEYIRATDAKQCHTESLDLLRHVLAHYAEIEITQSEPYFRNVKTLGDKAQKSLHSLENLRVGKEAPMIVGTDLQGKPLRLSDYKGKVVLLSFWSTDCGPCLQMIPEEQKLIETFDGQPFALLAVNNDQELTVAQDTAEKKGIDWPCWYDGQDQPIHKDYNVLMWPTFYLIDPEGKIAAKDVAPTEVAAEVKKLMEQYESKGDSSPGQ